uniref:DNA 5'-3' helicase n=1 Tax=viral metagenome TaxID=1070528 RepID=A0A6M3LKG1_9ZZZZ
MDDYQPPYDMSAEEAVNGSLLIDGNAIHEIAAVLTKDDFYNEANRLIYGACLSLYERDAAIDVVTLASELDRHGHIGESGGAAYLAHLTAVVPTSLDIEHYAAIVRRLSAMRQLLTAGRAIANIGATASDEVADALRKAEDALFKVGGKQNGTFVHIKKTINHMLEPQPETTGAINTGYPDIDHILKGLKPADLIVLAGRPSMGKTSLALNIVRNAALEQYARVAVFSLEMSGESLVQRLITSESGVSLTDSFMSVLSEDEERRVMQAMGVLAEGHILVDDSPLATASELRAKARRLHQAEGIDLLVIDYLQLMQGNNNKSDNRVQEISHITRNLKVLAKELHAPVILLSQLNRAVEGRQGHRPQLSDLRESGSIEQDADVVMFISREEMYYPNERDWHTAYPDKEYPRGMAQLQIAKHRNGPTGTVELRFVPTLTKFETLGSKGINLL